MSWKTLKIKDLGKVVTGKTPSSKNPELFGGEYPFITPSEMTYGERTAKPARFLSEAGAGSQRKLMVPAGSVAFACIASIGKCCLINRPTFTNQQVNSVVVDGSEHNPAFVYYLLVNERERIKAYASGAATPIINKSAFSDVNVLIPELWIQNRIASILSAYDDLIENNTRRIEILEEMARRLYEEWFVNFRFPGHEEVSFKESELGEIPDEWGTEAATDAFKIKYGKTFPKKNLDPSGQYPVFGGGGVIGRCDQFNIDGPTTLITSRGNGSGTVWRASEAGLVTNNAFTVMPKDSKLNTHYGYIEQVMLNASVMSVVGGAAQPQLTLDGLSGVRVMTPDPKVVDQFSLLVDPLYALVNRLQRKNANLRVQRDLLLPKLVSGDIDVSDIPMPSDKEVEAA